jgi:hypothetical protein
MRSNDDNADIDLASLLSSYLYITVEYSCDYETEISRHESAEVNVYL